MIQFAEEGPSSPSLPNGVSGRKWQKSILFMAEYYSIPSSLSVHLLGMCCFYILVILNSVVNAGSRYLFKVPSSVSLEMYTQMCNCWIIFLLLIF